MPGSFAFRSIVATSRTALTERPPSAHFTAASMGSTPAPRRQPMPIVMGFSASVAVVTTATEALKPMTIGIGCRRGAGVEPIDAAVKCALGGRSVNAVREVATIDLKANEPGIQAFCARYALPLRVFTHAQIAA